MRALHNRPRVQVYKSVIACFLYVYNTIIVLYYVYVTNVWALEGFLHELSLQFLSCNAHVLHIIINHQSERKLIATYIDNVYVRACAINDSSTLTRVQCLHIILYYSNIPWCIYLGAIHIMEIMRDVYLHGTSAGVHDKL